jgi:cell division protein FtsZ
MGIGRGHGDNRAADAAKAAIASPLLEVSIDGAKGILFTITGGSNLGMYEVSEAAKVITQSADSQAKVIFGAIIDETMKDEVKVTVIATGFETRSERPKVRSVLSSGTYVPPRPPEALERLPFTSRATPVTRQEPAPVPSRSMDVTPPPPVMEPEPRVPEPSPAARQPHVQVPSYAPIQQNRPMPAPPARIPSKASDEEDLEIPAFIRKKMM